MAVLCWRALAVLGAGLGLLGAVLPVMPTVPFLILSAWAASKGWPSFERWLLNHPVLGPPIVKWRERGAVPRRAKWLSSLMMASSAVGMQFFVQIPLWLRIGVPVVMLAVAIWLWRRPEA
ncbi:MAG: YbaN family protein [Pseudomonadota bacterium]|nr:YbaN family protein [Pseudomonadota bacterium]